jgi:hypothetical protein
MERSRWGSARPSSCSTALPWRRNITTMNAG